MAYRSGRLLTAVLILALAAPAARAADRCAAKATIAGKQVMLKSCAVALYESGNSVTIWLTENPISADELSTFQLNSDAKTSTRTTACARC